MDRTESSALLARAREGSRDALDRLFERVGGKLLALIRFRLGPELRAEVESRDILQSTLLLAFERLDQFEGTRSASLMAWLARIAESEIRAQARYHRRQKRDAGLRLPLEHLPAAAPDGLAADLRSQTSRLAIREEIERMEEALDRLPAHYREVILLRYYEELAFPKIGERLGRSADASRMLFARAMAALVLEMRGEA